jgi:AcrR family transcriptional regulator
MEAIAAKAGVTSGAFYHHFTDKRACFEAVYEVIEQELLDGIMAAADAQTEPWSKFLAGCDAFFEACTDADVRQIILIDGSSVLGWENWTAIEERYHFAGMRDGVRLLMKQRLLEPRPPDPLAMLLFGALNEAARLIAHSGEPERTRRELRDAFARVLEGLRPEGAHAE